jgi:hypothetical protein
LSHQAWGWDQKDIPKPCIFPAILCHILPPKSYNINLLQGFNIKHCIHCSSLSHELLYFPAYKTHWPIRCTMIFSLEILEKKWWWMYFNFSNLLEENRIVTYLVTRK